MIEDFEVTPGAGPNRRIVVRGAAWSLPVIAAMVAAPAAAAASATGAKVSFSPSSAAGGLRLTSMEGDSQTVYSATGPTSFTVTNGPSAVTGPITGTVTVEQGSDYLQKPKGIGVKTVQTSTASPAFTPSGTLKADTCTTTFSYAAGIEASSSLTLLITFGYQAGGLSLATTTPITYTATLRLSDSRGVQIGQAASASLSTSFVPVLSGQ